MTSSDNAPVILTERLLKRYGALVAVNHLEMQVPKGAVFGLLGPNGAGKSTTFGILCGWLRATGGRATVLGVDCRKLYTLRGRVAVLPQDARFPPNIPVRDQLVHFGRLMGLGRDGAHREADRVLEAVELTYTGEMRGLELSHGMLKRVGLAQTLIGAPDVIFLDEPTAGLDPKSARQIKNLVAGLAPKTTVVLSSHNLVDVQEICTHGAILNRGNLALAGTIDLLTRRGAEITVETKKGTPLPVEQLHRVFGRECVELDTFDSGVDVCIRFSPDQDVSAVIAKAVGIMLEHRVPMLGVRRGTSLETAFLEVTSNAGVRERTAGEPSSAKD